MIKVRVITTHELGIGFYMDIIQTTLEVVVRWAQLKRYFASLLLGKFGRVSAERTSRNTSMVFIFSWIRDKRSIIYYHRPDLRST
jgi:hypothetical protein